MRPPICDKTAPPHLENPGSATGTARFCGSGGTLGYGPRLGDMVPRGRYGPEGGMILRGMVLGGV